MKTLLQPIIIRVRTTISALMAAKGSLLENRANILDSIRFLSIILLVKLVHTGFLQNVYQLGAIQLSLFLYLHYK
jgi:hypothetical protein